MPKSATVSPSILRSMVTVEPHSLEWAVPEACGFKTANPGYCAANQDFLRVVESSAWIWPDSAKLSRALIAASFSQYIGVTAAGKGGLRFWASRPRAKRRKLRMRRPLSVHPCISRGHR